MPLCFIILKFNDTPVLTSHSQLSDSYTRTLNMQVSITSVHTLEAAKYEIGRLSFSPDGKTIAVGDEHNITLWDTAAGSLRWTFEDRDDCMFFEFAFSPDGKWVARPFDDGDGRIWSTATGELKQMVSVKDERMLSMAFSTDSKTIATGSEVLRVWDVETAELQHTLLGPGDHSLSFMARHAGLEDFDEYGPQACSDENDGREFPNDITEVFFSPSNEILVSVSPPTNTVRLWSTDNWKLKQTIEGYTASFSPDGAYLAVHGNIIRIYETVNWQLQSTINTTEGPYSPTFSPDSKMIATRSGRNITLCNIRSGELIRTFTDPTREVSEYSTLLGVAVAFSISLDGRVLISLTEECGLRVWNVETGECMLMLENKDEARDPWSPKGCRGGAPAFDTFFSERRGKVAVALFSGSVRVWDVTW